ncbi:MAG: hypothetical protein ACYCXA_12790 [Actinomycetes bacterium]
MLVAVGVLAAGCARAPGVAAGGSGPTGRASSGARGTPTTAGVSASPASSSALASASASGGGGAPWQVGLSTLGGVAVHFRYVITADTGVGSTVVRGSGAVDPVDQQAESTVSTTVTVPGASTPVMPVMSTRAIRIGRQAWGLVAGRWVHSTVRVDPPVDAAALVSALTDVHPVRGITVAGHVTTGWTGSITGVAMSQAVGLSAAQTRADGIIHQMVFTVYVGAGRHVRQMSLVEHVVAPGGHSYLVNEVVQYDEYGQALHLHPPTT